MTDTGDAIADIATGAVLARAVEPGQGAVGDDGHSHESACLNCGTALLGRHCHACGQAAHVHKALGAFFHDLLHGVFHFEGKIWRTLPMLAWHPGRLTREYIDGRRASYVSPISVPFVWLLFPFSRRFGVYDHTIFVTYSVSFMLLLISAISLGALWNVPGLLLVLVALYAPFHMYRQLKGAYDLTRFSAWWRTWFIALFAVMALSFFAVALTFLATGG